MPDIAQTWLYWNVPVRRVPQLAKDFCRLSLKSVEDGQTHSSELLVTVATDEFTDPGDTATGPFRDTPPALLNRRRNRLLGRMEPLPFGTHRDKSRSGPMPASQCLHCADQPGRAGALMKIGDAGHPWFELPIAFPRPDERLPCRIGNWNGDLSQTVVTYKPEQAV